MSTDPQGAAPTRAAPRHRLRAESGMLSLEAVWVLPVLALLVVGLLETVGLVRDVLLVQEAARMGARTAATTTGVDPVVTAAREAAPELDLDVEVTPSARGDGDLAVVHTRTTRTIGPVRHELSARAVVRVEPSVTHPGPGTNGIHGPVPP
ncbi:MAG: hypothetical protein WD638_11850 [Nitriliruptoraceae bacterium]